MKLLKQHGMNTLKDNIKAKNPIDILIFEKGLRIKNAIIDKDLDLIGVILNNGKIVEYGRKHYIQTPLNLTFTNLVNAVSKKNLGDVLKWLLIQKISN